MRNDHLQLTATIASVQGKLSIGTENWRATSMPRLDVLRESRRGHERPFTVATAMDRHIPIFDPRVVADLRRPGLSATVRLTTRGRLGILRACRTRRFIRRRDVRLCLGSASTGLVNGGTHICAVARVAGWSRCTDAIDRGRTGSQHN